MIEKTVDIGNGQYVTTALLVTADGTPYVASGGGGGGGGDASAANQTTGNNSLASIDSKATTTNNTLSTISGKLPTLVSGNQPSTLPNLEKSEDNAHTSGDVGIMALGVRQDADISPVSADGDYHSFVFNATGRLKSSVKPGATAATVGTITSSSSVVFCNVIRESNVTVSFSGTFAGVNATFEWSADSTTGSDGTWYPVTAARSVGAVAESVTGALTNTPAYNWRINVNGANFFRVRATAFTSGTANVTILPATFATEPNPTIASIPLVTTVSAVTAITNALPAGANNIGLTVDAPSTVAGAGIVPVATTAVAGSLVLKASAGNVYGLNMATGASAGYFMLFDATSAPADGTVTPKKVYYVAANSTAQVDYPRPIRMATGATLAFSTTGPFTKTTSVTAFMSGEVV